MVGLLSRFEDESILPMLIGILNGRKFNSFEEETSRTKNVVSYSYKPYSGSVKFFLKVTNEMIVSKAINYEVILPKTIRAHVTVTNQSYHLFFPVSILIADSQAKFESTSHD